MIKFNYDEKTRERKAQSYNPKEIFWIKNGEKINVYDFIQSGREDTEIYPTLEKYGSIKRMELDTPAVYAQFESIQNLRDCLEQQKQADQMWNALPLEIRQTFNHNKYDFMNNGMQWLQKRLEAEQPKNEIKTDESEVNNG